jgi:acetyl esterase
MAVLAAPALAPDVRAVVEASARAACGSGVADLRAAHDRDAAALAGPGPSMASVRDLAIPGPYGAIPLRVYKPARDASLPWIAYFHGGGWTVGSIDSFDGVARRLAAASGAAVVSVGYRLAPEHPFPVPIDEGLAVVRRLARDGGRVAVAGDSSGANIATVVARRLRDEGGPGPRAQALVYPVCDVALDTDSAREFAEGFGFTRAAMRRYWDLYLAGADGSHPDASPLRAASLRGLAPAFVATAGADVLRDEGEAYASALGAAGRSSRAATTGPPTASSAGRPGARLRAARCTT